MNEAIETAIKLLANKINDKVEAQESLHYTQAALNLANTLIKLKESEWYGK